MKLILPTDEVRTMAARLATRLTILWRWQLGRLTVYPPDLMLAIALIIGLRWLSVDIWQSTSIDVPIYAAYANAFWHGSPPWHALPHEYPPLTLLPFSLALVPPIFSASAAFTAWLAVAFVGGYLMTLVYAGRGAALLYLLYLPLGTAAFIVARFDLLPALCTLAAFFALQRSRFTLAGLALVVGGLLKIYPWFLLPLALVAAWQATAGPWTARLGQVARWSAWPLGLLVVGLTAPWLLNPHAAFSAFTNAAQRPIQVESFPSLIIWITTRLGQPATIDFTYGSHNWISPLSSALAQATTPALVLGCLAIAAAFGRGWFTLPRAFLATLVVVILTGRVFSTQYLIWLVPLVAVVEGLDLLWILICAATSLGTIIYPFNDPYTPDQLTQFMLVMLVRNGLLVVALIRLCWHQAPVAAPAAVAVGARGEWAQADR